MGFRIPALGFLGFPKGFRGFPLGFRWVSAGFPWVSHGFPRVSAGYPLGFRLGFRRFPRGFRKFYGFEQGRISRSFSVICKGLLFKDRKGFVAFSESKVSCKSSSQVFS